MLGRCQKLQLLPKNKTGGIIKTYNETASYVLKDVCNINYLAKHRSTVRQPHPAGSTTFNRRQSKQTFESRVLKITRTSMKWSLKPSTLSSMHLAALLLFSLILTPCIAADSPELPAANVIFSSVSASSTHSYGVSDQGQLYCWGSGSGAMLGLVEKVAPGREGAYIPGTDFNAYFSSRVRSYSSSINGDAEYTSPSPQYVPVKESAPAVVDDATDWKQVSAGGIYTCAIKTDGRLYCWGSNRDSQLGLGDALTYDTPTPISIDEAPKGNEDLKKTKAKRLEGKDK